MREFKGTKGKWEVKEYHDGEFIAISVESENAKVIFDTGYGGYIDNEEEANAKLIAASPEMLELLIKISEGKEFILQRDVKELLNKIL